MLMMANPPIAPPIPIPDLAPVESVGAEAEIWDEFELDDVVCVGEDEVWVADAEVCVLVVNDEVADEL